MTPLTFPLQVHYIEALKLLVIPHGVLAALRAAESSLEPALVPNVATPILRALLSNPPDVCAWRTQHQENLESAAKCFQSQLNIERALAAEVALESALLGPLFDIYRKAIFYQVEETTRLHPYYSNGELFYVLWALQHCGTARGSVTVNGALKNSLRFRRIFQCGFSQKMSISVRCSVST